MKTKRPLFDAFVISGFAASFFNGFLNPLYVSMILARLDPRVIAAGSFMASGFPVLIGALLGNRALFKRLYGALPAVMLVELALAVLAALLAAADVQAYYLASMLVLGVFSSSVIYLLQKLKEERYRTRRAAFDRRVEMADSLGFVAGSGLAVAGVSIFREPIAVAALGALQTAVVYGLFLLLHRAIPSRRGRRDDEEPHPWSTTRLVMALA
jgi:hypothetical protein